MRFLITAQGLIVVILLSLGLFNRSNAGTAPPNLLILLVDDMGYGDPGCYNAASKIPTPHIDRLAAEGMRFIDAHAAGPVCHPSRYGLLTGAFPLRTDVSVWPRHPVIQPGELTLGKMLQSKGYQTAMVGKWHLGFEENGYENPLPGGPLDCGFDTFFGIRASTDIPPYFYIRDRRAILPPTHFIAAGSTEGWSPIQGAFWREGGIAPDLVLAEVLPRFADEAVSVIEAHARSNASRPLMLYLAFPAPHTPWLPSEEFQGSSQAGLYGDFMVMVDAMIGRVLKALDRSGMSGNTMVLFSSDNGPVWYDVDKQRFNHDSMGGFRGMKGDAWEGGHRTPFIVRWPGTVPPGTVSSRLVSFTDVLATMAEVANFSLPPEAAPDSVSFLPTLRGAAAADSVRPGPVVLISSGGMESIRGLGSGGFTKPSRIQPGPDEPAGQLYRLDEDPGETRNLYPEHPEVVARLEAELAQAMKRNRTR